MIRANEPANTAALWARPLSVVASRTEARDAAAWFDAVTTGPDTICGDLSPAARGLSVEQHASRVLMHLRHDGERRA
jgi:hypothetical protein